MALFGFLLAHLAEIKLIIASLLGTASLVTGLTPSPADDSLVAKVRKTIGAVGLTTFSDQPGTFKLPGQSASPDASPMVFRDRK